MKRNPWRALLLMQLAMLPALLAGPAAAEPGSGPRETVDQSFTTTAPDTPTGIGYTGRYHAAGDENAPPPYMRRMTFHPPAGFRFDTSVPEQCTATDVELSVRGPAACPAGSRLGEGTTEGLFMAPITHSFVFDHFVHHVDLMNNANEQILLVESEGWTVVRGQVHPDNSVEFNSPTCFPPPPGGGCPDEYIIQLGSTTSIAPITSASGSYATTPPTCPLAGHWDTTIKFWWSDGAIDSVVSRQPCSAAQQ
jgi:hypothetical protein